MAKFVTDKVPTACLLMFLFEHQYLYSYKDWKTHNTVFAFNMPPGEDYADLESQLFSEESILVGNGLQLIEATLKVRKEISTAAGRERQKRTA